MPVNLYRRMFMLEGDRMEPFPEAPRQPGQMRRQAAGKGSRKRGQPSANAIAGAIEARNPSVALPPTLWTQKQAAEFLRVSVRYVRDSSIPKLLLPGKGPARRPLVRYDPHAVQEWYNRHSTTESAA
jgi:hypothetical protein